MDSAWPATQSAAADLTDELRNTAALLFQLADDLQPSDSIAGDHMPVVVRRCLNGSFRFGDVASQPVPFARLMVARFIVRLNLCAKKSASD